MPKCDFSKVAIAHRHGYSSINLLHIFRTPFSKSIFGGLLLDEVSLKLSRKKRTRITLRSSLVRHIYERPTRFSHLIGSF